MNTRTVWRDRSKTPLRAGWYITRTEDGYVSWRAWGKGAWWKQLKDGWIEWFDADCNSMRYEWIARSRQSIDLNSDELPGISGSMLDGKEHKEFPNT